MTPADLQKAGHALFGKRWKAALARALGRDPSMIWRYATGKIEIPHWLPLAIKGLQEKK